MNIKSKLSIYIALLLLLFLSNGLVSVLYIHTLQQDTKNILTDNYNSLTYMTEILKSLNDSSVTGVHVIEKNIQLQEQNITEKGEKQLTTNLRQQFEQYKRNPEQVSLSKQLQVTTVTIMNMNMLTIQQKSYFAQETASEAVKNIIVVTSLCLMVCVIFIYKVPSSISKPIKDFSEKIRQIAMKNYSQRVQYQGLKEISDLAISFNTMAEKLDEYEHSTLAQLMAEKKRIETLISAIPHPVLGFDDEGTLIFINNEALTVCGMDSEQLLGLSLEQLAISNDILQNLIGDVFQRDIAEKSIPPILHVVINGREEYFDKKIVDVFSPTQNSDKRFAGYMIFLKNITEYKELDSLKTNFIATISHELKTPIASVQLATKLLQNNTIGIINSEQRSLIEGIENDVDRLLRIVQELLNVSQIESNRVFLTITPVNLNEIIHYAVQAVRMQAEAKKITISVQTPNDVPPVLADSEKTAWVIVNLLSNAIRYSYQETSVVLTIVVREKYLELAVSDAGPGIPPEYVDKIFERYFKIPGSSKQGTGLGLSISKEFIEAQGGNIALESTLGKGSTFILTLLTEKN